MIDFLSYFRTSADPQAMIALAAVVFLLVLAALWKSLKHGRPHARAKPLLTSNEKEFFYRLQRAIPALHVFPQVSFAAFITDDGSLSGKARWSARASFDRKIADFVICERGTFNVLALVELDDRTHTASVDRQRDAITQAAGYRTIRFQSTNKPTVAEIAELFHHLPRVAT